MTAAPAWTAEDCWDEQIPYWIMHTLTAEQWQAMPEDICRRIEVVDGQVVFMQAPTRDHQMACGLFWAALRTHASRAAAASGQCLASVFDTDLRLESALLHHRRPDVVVFRCVDRDALIQPMDTLLVVEVVSPTSRVRDKIDKLAEYAEAGIPHYWTVELRDGAIATVTWYALPEGEKRYEVRGCWTPAETPDGIRAEDPFPIRIAWDELAF
jgi:Uma2 family endonuclease